MFLQACMEDDKQYMLIILARPLKEKTACGLSGWLSGKPQSGRELLLDLKARGLAIPPKLAIGYGAMGFWGALEEVWPQTSNQCCWVLTQPMF